MSNDPYSSPSNDVEVNTAVNSQMLVQGPAKGLIVVSIICIAFMSIALLFNGYLLASGMAGQMQQPSIGISKETQIAIRSAWCGIILIANITILIAAIKMRKLHNFSFSRIGAILAVIPCIGPCYVLGIPFGIWALIALHKPGVRDDFR